MNKYLNTLFIITAIFLIIFLKFLNKKNKYLEQGSIVSNRISEDGENVGYCYRTKEKLGENDSGWRFFSGDEDDTYLKNPNNLKVYKLSIVCNLDKNIEEILKSPYGTKLKINEKGKLVKVENK